MPFDLTRYDNPEPFRNTTSAYLLKREAEHNLLLGIAGVLDGGPYAPPAAPYLASLAGDAEVAGVAILTPPFRIVLSEMDEAVPLGLIVDDVLGGGWAPAGVLGPTELAFGFARLWNAAAGGTYRLGAREWIYRLTDVRRPAAVPGRMRAADPSDRDLLIGWVQGFNRDAMHVEVSPETAAAAVDGRLGGHAASVFVWDDGQPRSMAMLTGPTPNGIRINGVYTPAENRGRGYARACVAELSERQLAAGRTFCFLFADADYPTSNFVYESIGYQRVTEVQEIDFLS